MGSRRSSEQGQVLVLFALSLTVLLGATGLVVDLGGAWGQGRSQQKVADTAAMAGATAETNGATNAQIKTAATSSAVANGFSASEVTVNIPPAQGAYAPGPSHSAEVNADLAKDCSDATTLTRPCYVEVVISRPHQNSFAAVLGLSTFGVSERGVAIGGIANSVTNGLSPIQFNKSALSAGPGPGQERTYCDPQNVHCSPQTTFPLPPSPPDNNWQFNWTTFCIGPANCNVDAATAKQIIQGGNFQVTVTLDMFLGPHNNGGMDAVCKALKDQYPTGADLPVAISDDNGHLVAFWIWHFDATAEGTKCTGDETIAGYFVNDISSSLPLTITPGGGTATTGQYVVRLVE